MVKDKLILPSSYGAVKIAGLYLLSDILHNAGAPVKHASAYRFVLSFSLCIVLHSWVLWAVGFISHTKVISFERMHLPDIFVSSRSLSLIFNVSCYLNFSQQEFGARGAARNIRKFGCSLPQHVRPHVCF